MHSDQKAPDNFNLKEHQAGIRTLPSKTVRINPSLPPNLDLKGCSQSVLLLGLPLRMWMNKSSLLCSRQVPKASVISPEARHKEVDDIRSRSDPLFESSQNSALEYGLGTNK